MGGVNTSGQSRTGDRHGLFSYGGRCGYYERAWLKEISFATLSAKGYRCWLAEVGWSS